MASAGGRTWRILAVIAACLDAFGVVVYLLIIDGQGDSVTGTGTLGWAAAMALPGVLCLVAASTPARVARWLLLLAIPRAGGIGLLAILTIGLIFLLVAMLAMVAAAVCRTVRVQPAQPPVPLTNSQA